METLEAPSREVADARRRELAAGVAEKPGFKDAIATIERLEGELLPDGSPARLPRAPVDANGAAKSARKNTEPRPLPRAVQKTSPSLESVLGKPKVTAEEETITPIKPSALPRIGGAVVGLSLVVIAAWLIWTRDAEQPTEKRADRPATSTATATASAKQSATTMVTTPVTATATASEDPTPTTTASSAVSARSVRSGRPVKTASASVETATAPKSATATASATSTTSSSGKPRWYP